MSRKPFEKPLFAHILTTVSAARFVDSLGWFSPLSLSHWQHGHWTKTLTHEIQKTFPETHHIVTTYNARTALYHGLKSLGIQPGDEVILQAYTCVSVPNAIIAAWAKPIYIDIDPTTANIDPLLIKTAITPKTKAILIQHTFGMPADIAAIHTLCRDHKLYLIEDCAHALGASYQGRPCGSFGDIALLSFGRDKVISSVNGGVLLINNPHLPAPDMDLKMSDRALIAKNLAYNILGYLARITYRIGLWKGIYRLSAKLGAFPPIVTPAEKACHFTDLNNTLPNALAQLATADRKRMSDYNAHRRQVWHQYQQRRPKHMIKGPDGSIYLRTLFVARDRLHRDQIMRHAKDHSILLGDRYQQVLAPKGTSLENAGYVLGSCPHAEWLADRTLNIPNHPCITEADVDTIIDVLSEVL